MRKRGLSPTLLIPLSWMFLSISRGVKFWEPPKELLTIEELTAGSPLERLAFSLLIILSLYVLYRRRARVWPLLMNNTILIVLFLFMAMSVVWADFPMVSIRRYFKVSGTLLTVLTVLTEDEPYNRVDELLLVFFMLTISLSVLFIHSFPQLGTDVVSRGHYTWIGITYTKNNLGQLAATSSLYLFWKILEHRSSRRSVVLYICVLMSLYLLVGSQSVTSWGMMLIGTGILLFLRSTRNFARQLSIILLFSIPILIINLSLWSDLFLRRPLLEYGVTQTGREMTFTGRTILWRDVVSYALKRPILGYGYGGFWIGSLGTYLWGKYTWHPNQAHNGYLDILSSLGVAGLIIFLIFLFITLKKVAATLQDNHSYISLSLTVLIVICFTNLFESSFIRLNHLLWFFFLLFGIAPASRVSMYASADQNNLEVFDSCA